MGMAEELETAAAGVAETVFPALVGVGSRGPVGSGLVVEPGLILTCAHNVRFPGRSLHFADGRQEAAGEIRFDPALDLALVSADTAGIGAPAWSEAPPKLGTPVLAAARPGDQGSRIAPGVVGYLSAAAVGLESFEHTAALPRGASGGPVVGWDGLVLGLDVRRGDAAYEALVTDAALRQRVEALARGEARTRGWLGVVLYPDEVARRLRAAVGLGASQGALVREAIPGGPAERAGLCQGDLVLQADGSPVAGAAELQRHLVTLAPGASVRLTVARQSETLELQAVMEESPEPAWHGRRHFGRGPRRRHQH